MTSKTIFEANTISHDTVIKACAEARDAARAKHWVPMMMKAGVETNTISYSDQELWMSMMLKAGVEADTISYKAAIKACADARDVGRAEYWISLMLKAFVEANIISYSTVIKACAEARDVTRAEHWM